MTIRKSTQMPPTRLFVRSCKRIRQFPRFFQPCAPLAKPEAAFEKPHSKQSNLSSLGQIRQLPPHVKSLPLPPIPCPPFLLSAFICVHLRYFSSDKPYVSPPGRSA